LVRITKAGQGKTITTAPRPSHATNSASVATALSGTTLQGKRFPVARSGFYQLKVLTGGVQKFLGLTKRPPPAALFSTLGAQVVDELSKSFDPLFGGAYMLTREPDGICVVLLHG